MKHTHHEHELDVPGKDSHRHRTAGAHVVGILAPNLNAAFWRPAAAANEAGSRDARYEAFANQFASCQLVIVEGDTQATALKAEVWRAAIGSPPIAASDPSVNLVISDDQPVATASGETIWLARSDSAQVADWILRELGVAMLTEPTDEP